MQQQRMQMMQQQQQRQQLQQQQQQQQVMLNFMIFFPIFQFHGKKDCLQFYGIFFSATTATTTTANK